MSSENQLCLTPYIKSLMMSPPNFTTADLEFVLSLIFNGVPNEIQIGVFLTLLSERKLDKDAKYVSTAVKTMLQFSSIPKLDYPKLGNQKTFADIVGTGGDGQNTFNVSTSSAIVVSGMGHPDVVVVKHGGKASTSNSGAGDLIMNLGVDSSKINASSVPRIIDTPFIFLFAPSFHHGMKSVINVRKSLGIPTIFNILGPLLNPIKVNARVLGVYSESLGELYAETIKQLTPEQFDQFSSDPTGINYDQHYNIDNKYRILVVWGEIGLDEVAPCGRTKIWYIDPKSKQVNTEYLSPSDFGLPEHSIASVQSKSPEENAKYLRDKILKNNIDLEAHDPITDYILMNSAVLAVSCGIAKDWKHGVALAKESIRSGKALKSLNALVQKVAGL